MHGMHVTLIVSAVLLLLGALAALRLPRTMETRDDEADTAAEAPQDQGRNASEGRDRNENGARKRGPAEQEHAAAPQAGAESQADKEGAEEAPGDGEFRKHVPTAPSVPAARQNGSDKRESGQGERKSVRNGLPRQSGRSKDGAGSTTHNQPGDEDLLPSGITRP